jgi:hypothetical protein
MMSKLINTQKCTLGALAGAGVFLLMAALPVQADSCHDAKKACDGEKIEACKPCDGEKKAACDAVVKRAACDAEAAVECTDKKRSWYQFWRRK